MISPRVTTLIPELGLEPHPEGGYYREVYRSPGRVVTADGRGERSALTTIYFLLAAGQISRWHRVLSDEVWHYYEGDALELQMLSPDLTEQRTAYLGPPDGDTAAPVAVVPAGWWQAARPAGAYTLVGCTVAPGFEFADFTLVETGSDAAETILARFPDLADFL